MTAGEAELRRLARELLDAEAAYRLRRPGPLESAQRGPSPALVAEGRLARARARLEAALAAAPVGERAGSC